MDFVALHGQHRVILKLASGLIGTADEVRTPDDAVAARRALERLDRILMSHLAVEDEVVMPVLLDSEDAGTRAAALCCHEEMGGIASVWADYLTKWDAERIHREQARFAAVTRGLMAALAHRVDREERELYPLAQAAGARAA
ncbi:hemerythrin domain-containing protein [uncultured Brevundimonas sp.]|uniref:hemerythrin domain-containing protein n=1 Tax=uncultured Brevundimonas sp. TaxID=213418 RepID=UPI00261E1AC9|nr:hemerythrin domain-containing protein [uncultured Brevundimonas sp.]